MTDSTSMSMKMLFTEPVKFKDNLFTWNQVCETPPSVTKKFESGGFEGTSINSIYPVKLATEQWGPIGVNWGYEIIEEKFIEGGPIFGSDSDNNQIELCRASIHMLRLELTVLFPERVSRIQHYGHTPFVFQDVSGIRTELEPHKKSLTSALKKCLSMHGFSADVYAGLFDDNDYIERQRNAEASVVAEQKFQENLKADKEYGVWAQKILQHIEKTKTSIDLESICATATRKAQAKSDIELVKQIEVLRMEVMKQISGDDNG